MVNIKSKILRNKILLISLLLFITVFYTIIHFTAVKVQTYNEDYHVWLIFTKVTRVSPLKQKFIDLIRNVLNVTTVPLNFNIIVDNNSKIIAQNELEKQLQKVPKLIHTYKFYDVIECGKSIKDIVTVMTNFFSRPGSYYSDTSFYISLGLHRIAPLEQKHAILLDCDIYFKKDISVLFDQFKSFKPTALFGLAPELTPVYRHVLHIYKTKHNTSFGDFYDTNNVLNKSLTHPKGYQGYNSGVVLLNFERIRKSEEFKMLTQFNIVQNMTVKYSFKGHLGDQDFYTLLGYEYPHLIQTLHCGFNRQLCIWWRDHGYKDVFDKYSKCLHETIILHGNCNTRDRKSVV